MNLLSRLKSGLFKSSSKITEGVAAIFTKRKLDEDTLAELASLAKGGTAGGAVDDEAGSGMMPSFGSAVNSNSQAMANPRDVVISLTRKFASEAPNTVTSWPRAAAVQAASRPATPAPTKTRPRRPSKIQVRRFASSSRGR